MLSQTVAVNLERYGMAGSEKAAELCKMADNFFDCLNVRSIEEGKRKRKPFLLPYSSVDDKRFKWLKETLLSYFQNLLKNIEAREGEFSVKEKAKMFVAKQTCIVMTVNSIVECNKFLLNEGMEYV